jgi:hypothetical protein
MTGSGTGLDGCDGGDWGVWRDEEELMGDWSVHKREDMSRRREVMVVGRRWGRAGRGEKGKRVWCVLHKDNSARRAGQEQVMR